MLLAAAVGVAACSIWFWWLCQFQPTIIFLSRHAHSQWIVYPRPPLPHLQARAELPAVFSRSFTLETVPSSVVLEARACKRCTVEINGNVCLPAAGNSSSVLDSVSSSAARNWKQVQTRQVQSYLTNGENRISVTVFNDVAPPALWLSLTGHGLNIGSDPSWECSYAGSIWQPAHVAEKRVFAESGNPMMTQSDVVVSLRRERIFVGVAALLAVMLALLGRVWFERPRTPLLRARWLDDPAQLLFLTLLILWVILLSHNVGFVPRNAGFDTEAHLEYIQYIEERGALPLAHEGWEMHHPPFYYMLSAVLLKAAGIRIASYEALLVLRTLSLVISLAHLGLIFAALRLVFPGSPARQTVGLLLAGFVPMHLYLTHYITNETLAACLISATIYFSLRMVRNSPRSLWDSLGLSISLGLALLTKLTAFIAVPFATAAMLFSLLRSQKQTLLPTEKISFVDRPRSPLTLLITTVLVCFLICGWHYFRVWRHFGNPFITNMDPKLPFAWWQDPGFRTAAYFSSFGNSLTKPFFSGLYSFADGLYSTLWGDGLWGGVAASLSRPPWNYDRMSVGYLMSLFPTLLLLIGLVYAFYGIFGRSGIPNGTSARQTSPVRGPDSTKPRKRECLRQSFINRLVHPAGILGRHGRGCLALKFHRSFLRGGEVVLWILGHNPTVRVRRVRLGLGYAARRGAETSRSVSVGSLGDH
jgi:hypothetical protein